MSKLTISEAAKLKGVSVSTLRRWESEGKLIPERTANGHRRYTISQLLGLKENLSYTVGYCRVSSHDQKKDLERQKEVVELFCAQNGWQVEIIDDLGSGLNYNKKGLKRLIRLIVDSKVERLVLTHKDRLLRFGRELIFSLCEQFGTEVVIINRTEDSTFEEDLAEDVLEIITVFSARLYGSRSHKNRKIVEELRDVATLGFKTELKLNNQQRSLLAQHAGTARHAWNWGLALTKQILDHNQANPDEKIKFPTAIDLHKWLVALVKSEHDWYYQVSKCAPQWALRALSDAWKRCFKKIAKPPNFKKKGKQDSFTLDGSIKVAHQKIKVPVIGWLKTYERLPYGYQPKSVTISKKANRWFISFKMEVEQQTTNKTHDVVGCDLGIKSLATLSTGETFEGSKSYRKYEKQLARLQYLNRHKVKGSNNWNKAQRQIAKLHFKIANIRKDTLHKLTTYLAKNHGKIVIEDLNVSGMMANHKLAKAVQDMGFYEFRRQLDYKTQLYGSELIIADRWFPSSKTCSNCGYKKESLSLTERVFECEQCHVVCGRDLNASLNLASLAVSSTVSACGVDSADTTTVKQEVNVKFAHE